MSTKERRGHKGAITPYSDIPVMSAVVMSMPSSGCKPAYLALPPKKHITLEFAVGGPPAVSVSSASKKSTGREANPDTLSCDLPTSVPPVITGSNVNTVSPCVGGCAAGTPPTAAAGSPAT